MYNCRFLESMDATELLTLYDDFIDKNLVKGKNILTNTKRIKRGLQL